MACNNFSPLFKTSSVSELDVFEKPSFSTGIDKMHYLEMRPTSQITTESSPIEFMISGQNRDYTDLKRSTLHVTAKILMSDGSPLPEEAHVAPVNLWLHSLWSQIDIKLNGKLVTTSSNLYPYKSYLKLLLGTQNEDASNTGQLFYRDSHRDMNNTDPYTGGNVGLMSRGDHVEQSKSVTMYGPIFEDVMGCDKFLINGVDINIKLHPSSPKFNLMSGVVNAGCKVVLEDVYLRLCKIRPTESIITGHASILNTEDAVYPYIKTDLRVASIATGLQSFTWDHIFQDCCPNKVIIGLVSSKAMEGDYKENPFNFKSFNASNIGLFIDGDSVPGQPMEISEANMITAYQGLFDPRNPITPNITREAFKTGYTLFQFTLEPYYGREFVDQIKKGNVCLKVRFSSALTETVSCLVYAEVPQVLKIDKARNIVTESS